MRLHISYVLVTLSGWRGEASSLDGGNGCQRGRAVVNSGWRLVCEAALMKYEIVFKTCFLAPCMSKCSGTRLPDKSDTLT